MWPSTQMLDGYVLKSNDVQGRLVRDLPRILGMHPAYLKEVGAIYGLPQLSPSVLSAITGVGFNNDRVPGNADSFYRPSLMAGTANAMRGDANAAAEIQALYGSGGMLIKFKFDHKSATTTPVPVPGGPEVRFPNGAGIREYVLHRPASFTLIKTFSTLDQSARVPSV